MPRYYFDIQDGQHIHDVDGIELSNSAEAEQEALRVLLDAAVDMVRETTSVEHQLPLTVTLRCGGTPTLRATLSIAIDTLGGR